MSHLIGRTILSVVVGVLSIIFVVVLAYQFPQLMVRVFDFNVSLIKAVCSLLPAYYDNVAEVTLRGMLAADRAMLFVEAALLVRAFLFASGLLSLFPDKKVG